MQSENLASPSSEISPASPAPAESQVEPHKRFYSRPAFWAGGFVLAVLVVGLGIRMYDLTNQPLDFHPTRQLRGAIIARGMYYQMLPNADPELRRQAINFWYSTGQYEPSFIEKIVAYTYLWMGGEYLWVSRIYTSLFWIIGGIALFALARRMLAPPEPGARPYVLPAGALLALGYYLFLPFAVQASRSIQPDPGMVMWIILFVYALFRWSEQPSWKWAVLAGLWGGIAVLVKIPAVYIVAGASVGLVLYTLGVRRFWRSPQVWVMLVLMVLPSAIYYLGIRQGHASDYFENWTLALSHLLLEPAFYVRWFSFVQDLVGFAAIILSLVGVLIASSRSRTLLLGLWGGYLLYGLSLPYQMYTHSYYHLQLVPIIALSLAPVGQLIFDRIRQQKKIWQALFIAVVVIAAVFQVWVARSTIAQKDYRLEPAYWQEIGSKLPTDGKIIALTQDYGYRLMYYGWRKVVLWPNRGEQALAALRGKTKAFEDYFAKHTENKNYFLVTAPGQLNDQPDLKQTLNDKYPILTQGDGYVIFDLAHPK